MPTLAALEIALADYKRSQAEFGTLTDRQTVLVTEMTAIQRQMETVRASLAANEGALRSVARQFSEAVRGT